MRPETEPWWRQSQADMAVARQLIQPESYYASAWFAHQAVEKGLKALYIERHQVQAARTHDLVYLSSALTLPSKFVVHIPTIDRAFELTRYPDLVTLVAPIDGVNEATALNIFQSAEEVMTWLEAQLP